jgi:DNA-binding XRE family transcriptional regulator
MPRPKPTSRALYERKDRAQEWKVFRRNNLLTQKRLAHIMGVSRRTIQLVEGAYITPHPKTLRLFSQFKNKYDSRVNTA